MTADILTADLDGRNTARLLTAIRHAVGKRPENRRHRQSHTLAETISGWEAKIVTAVRHAAGRQPRVTG